MATQLLFTGDRFETPVFQSDRRYLRRSTSGDVGLASGITIEMRTTSQVNTGEPWLAYRISLGSYYSHTFLTTTVGGVTQNATVTVPGPNMTTCKL